MLIKDQKLVLPSIMYCYLYPILDRYQDWLREQQGDKQRAVVSELDTKLATPRSGTGAFYRPMSERAIDSALDHQVPDHHVEPDQVCGCGWVYVGVGCVGCGCGCL